jgi:hypothetical protein
VDPLLSGLSVLLPVFKLPRRNSQMYILYMVKIGLIGLVRAMQRGLLRYCMDSQMMKNSIITQDAHVYAYHNLTVA